MSSTVLITGASSGIGLEFARIFAREGYALVLVARSMDRLSALAMELDSVTITLIQKDLSEIGSGQMIYDDVISKEITIDILVNNAGIGDYGYFHESDLSKQIRMIDLNIRTLTELTYLFGKDMLARKSGKVLNVASTAAFQPGPLMSVYFATKHYVLAFSEGIAEEWKSLGVIVTTLCPGPTESGFQDAARASENQIFSKKLPTSREVAEYGFAALMRGKGVAIHGRMNTLLAFMVGLTPRWLVRKVIMIMQSKKSKSSL